MKLWTVELTTTVVVVANSEKEAERLATAEIIDQTFAATTSPRFVPNDGWDATCIPYRDMERDDPRLDWTIGQWLQSEAGEARAGE